MEIVKKRKLLVISIILYLILLIIKPDIVYTALGYLKSFVLEMVQVLPLVFIVSALITEWVPARLISRHLGSKSGIRGVFYSLVLGSLSAGPIYAAFPMTHSLYKKGASINSIVIIISSWAVIKVPMLLMELKFLGSEFAFLRYAITVPAILLLGFVMSRMKKFGIPLTIDGDHDQSEPDNEYLCLLPGNDCKACGYSTCAELAAAADSPGFVNSKCVFLS